MNMEQLLLAASEGLDLKRQRGRRSSGGGWEGSGGEGEAKRGREGGSKRSLAHAAVHKSVTHGQTHNRPHMTPTDAGDALVRPNGGENKASSGPV